MKNLILFIFVLSLFFPKLALTQETETPVTELITYEEVREKIFVPFKCMQCHKSVVGSEAKLWKWIDEEAPEESKLYVRVQTDSMPKKGPKVPEELKALLLQYIKDYISTP